MEKLLNLINEYHYANSEVCKYLYNDEAKKIYFRTMLEDGDTDEERIDDEWIISKRFGFIKWLVDNDKIDKEFEDKKFLGDIFDSGYRYNNSFIEERLLCYLALTDEPIQFLISVLK